MCKLIHLHSSDRSRSNQSFQFRLKWLLPKVDVPLDLRQRDGVSLEHCSSPIWTFSLRALCMFLTILEHRCQLEVLILHGRRCFIYQFQLLFKIHDLLLQIVQPLSVNIAVHCSNCFTSELLLPKGLPSPMLLMHPVQQGLWIRDLSRLPKSLIRLIVIVQARL